MAIYSVLRQVHLFQGLNDMEIADVAARCRVCHIRPQQEFLSQNAVGNDLFIIGDGEVEIFARYRSGVKPLITLGAGQVLGELALLDQGYRSASAKAGAQGATLLQLSAAAFFDLCEANRNIGYIVMRNLGTELAFKLRHANLANP